jgi:hypothetical protein
MACVPPSAGVPTRTIVSGPDSSIVSSIASAIPVRASSQETRSKRPSPRSPTRRRGWSTRSSP